MTIDIEKLKDISTWPMELGWIGGDVDDLGRPLPLRFERPDRRVITEAIVESATINGRPLTESELEWVNENHPEWVAELANEEHTDDDENENEIPSCEYFGTYRCI